MFLKFLFCVLFLWASVSRGSVLSVDDPHIHFTLSLDKDLLTLKGSQFDLSMKKNKCNQRIIADFIRQYNSLLRERPLERTPFSKRAFKFTHRGREYYADPRSSLGSNLLGIPRAFWAIKMQEKFLCKPKGPAET